MAIGKKICVVPEEPRPAAAEAPRLYLVTPSISSPAKGLPLSEEAAAACGVACLLIRTAAQSEAANEQIFRALATPMQERGIACLVADDPQFCLRANADGAHLNGDGPRLEQALPVLKPSFIVGAGGLRTRHDAMAAAEAGADYVMFGESGGPQSAVADLVAWWAENITVPCVGYASSLESVSLLASAGADFIALGSAVFSDPRGAETALREAASLLKPALEGGYNAGRA
jgi:thiamine-phosphate pyrophosphorylase